MELANLERIAKLMLWAVAHISSLQREYLGLAAEFAVASQLCRRGLYAQLTLGMHKRTDLLVDTDASMLRIQVKAKQGRVWPNCIGVSGRDIVLILVDFADKHESERPDFYILTSDDWRNLVTKELKGPISTGEVLLDDTNIPLWVRQVNKQGQPYKGMGVSVSQISAYRECWDRIKTMVSSR